MNAKVRKTLVWSGIVLGILFGVFLILMSIAVNVIVTPSKVTPIVVRYVNNNYNVDFDVDEVDVTFFSSFPHLGLRLTNGTLVSRALHPDTVPNTRRDSLLAFDDARISFGLMRYLRKNELSINDLKIERPRVMLYCDTAGRANWDVMPADTIEAEEDTTAAEDMPIVLKRIRLNNLKFAYVDKVARTSFRLDSANLMLGGSFVKEDFSVDIKYDGKKASFRQSGTRYLRRMAVTVDAHVTYDNNQNCYRLSDSRIGVNGVDLDADGTLTLDTAGNRLGIDIDYRLHAPSVEKAMALIPETVIARDALKASGSVALDGRIEGFLSQTEYPRVSCKMLMDKVTAKYVSMQYGIEELTADFDAYIDVADNDSSHLSLNIFRFVGAETDVLARARVNRLFTDPHIVATTQASVNLNNISKMFPLKPGIGFKGFLKSDLVLECNLSDITGHNYGRICVSGDISCDSLEIRNDSVGFCLTNDFSRVNLQTRADKTVNVNAKLKRMRFDLPSLKIRMRDVESSVATVLQPDTTAIVPLRCITSARRFTFRKDSSAVFVKQLNVDLEARPSEADRRLPYMSLGIRTDTVRGRSSGVRGVAEMLGASMVLERQADSSWYSDGYFGFRRMAAMVPGYKLPVEASETKITQGDRTFVVERAHVRVGRSEFDIKGNVHNLYYSIRNRTRLDADVEIDADTLDVNELMSAVDENYAEAATAEPEQEVESISIDSLAQTAVAADTVVPRIFKVPSNINIDFSTKINHLIFSGLSFDEIAGKVKVTNSCVHLLGLRMKQNGSPLITTMVYKDLTAESAYLGCFLRWERADIADIIGSLKLDTVMPMLAPLQGKVSCYMAAETEIDTAFNANMSTLHANLCVAGDSMVLLDGDMFAKISKMLMFKNKKRNVFEPMSVNIHLKDSLIVVDPTVVSIDRYKAVVGGHQDYDMKKLDYQISILKSPLPFKAGLNIDGDIDDLNFDVTKARLKAYATDAEQARIDSLSRDERKRIIQKFYDVSGIEMPEALK